MADIATLRKDYALAGLTADELKVNPIDQFNRWFDQAHKAGVIEPNAMTLATADEAGFPSARTVLLKGVDDRGFAFFTNYQSAKGRELTANPRATLVFPWLALERQVVIRGTVDRVSRAESEAYFETRPIGSQMGAWASTQSTLVKSRQDLEDQLAVVERRFAGRPVPIPPHWGGFRLSPVTMEFWQGRPNRLHDRLRYRREGDDWIIERLNP